MGGETYCRCQRLASASGLSPRGRGNHSNGRSGNVYQRSIPAWAGKPDDRLAATSTSMVYPRVGGETRLERREPAIVPGLSPRGRGNPLGSRSQASRAAVYPRVGGETGNCSTEQGRRDGLSPRGRGNRPRPFRQARIARSIPAWAGKPSSSGGKGGATGSIPAWAGKPISASCVFS